MTTHALSQQDVIRLIMRTIDFSNGGSVCEAVENWCAVNTFFGTACDGVSLAMWDTLSLSTFGANAMNMFPNVQP